MEPGIYPTIKNIAVCICTYNRADMLQMVLKKLDSMIFPAGISVAVLIIDNNSSDHTASVVHKFVTRRPDMFRYIFESRQGLSCARNRGLQETESDVIAFLDDDAVPRDGWLEALLEGYAEGADVGAVGGQALLAFQSPSLPRWFKKPLFPYFSEKEAAGTGLQTCSRPDEFPFGANISFLRCAAVAAGGFNPNLGRSGKKMLSGEEVELCMRLRNLGYRILLHPKSIVDHYMPQERITLTNLMRQAWADGQCRQAWQETGDASPNMIGAIKMLLISCGKLVGRIILKPKTSHDLF